MDGNQSPIQPLRSKSKLIKISLLFLFLLGTVIGEVYYRKPLFDYSIRFEADWQNASSSFIITIFKGITQAGQEFFFIGFLMIIFFITPLTFSLTYFFGFIMSLYFVSIMKIWYGNLRPFWHVPTLSKACDGGFGNPSGHSFCSAFIYLSINKLIIESKPFRSRLLPKILSFVFFIGVIVLIMLSRIILGVHSFNQIIYGASLGLSFYLFIYHILEIDQYSSKDFKVFFTNIKWIIIVTLFFIVWIASAILSFYYIPNIVEKDKEDNLMKACPNTHNYRKFNNDGLLGTFTLFSFIGSYYGLVLLWPIVEKKFHNDDEIIVYWSLKWESYKDYLKAITIYFLFLLPALLSLLPLYERNYPIGFILRFGIPMGVSMFLEYSFGIYLTLLFTERKVIINEPTVNESEVLMRDGNVV